VALVTGASRGIGRAIALRLARDGATVMINYRSDGAAAAEVVESIERTGGRAEAVSADISDPERLRALFDEAERRFGPLDVVASNVGTARFGALIDAEVADFDAVFTTNARAGFTVLREAARRVRDGGRIVAVSAGFTVTRQPGTALYAASKAALEQLVRVLAVELGPRQVTVNSVLPGPVRTDALDSLPSSAVDRMIAEVPLGRLGQPEDIADIVGFLASHDARWVTGQSIHAGGGAF
jgi:3-oxoacyl-[acyl-carrier protein] reductase